MGECDMKNKFVSEFSHGSPFPSCLIDFRLSGAFSWLSFAIQTDVFINIPENLYRVSLENKFLNMDLLDQKAYGS
jgi:hypothetical protein